jgi:hypothetical protein
MYATELTRSFRSVMGCSCISASFSISEICFVAHANLFTASRNMYRKGACRLKFTWPEQPVCKLVGALESGFPPQTPSPGEVRIPTETPGNTNQADAPPQGAHTLTHRHTHTHTHTHTKYTHRHAETRPDRKSSRVTSSTQRKKVLEGMGKEREGWGSLYLAFPRIKCGEARHGYTIHKGWVSGPGLWEGNL